MIYQLLKCISYNSNTDIFIFSYMGGANFWGGTKENDVSITLYKLLMFYLSIYL